LHSGSINHPDYVNNLNGKTKYEYIRDMLDERFVYASKIVFTWKCYFLLSL